jgi:nucleoside deoxyribosyltransferase
MIDNKPYLAGPFFNDEQLAVIARLEMLYKMHNHPFFSPRLECFCPPKATPEQRRDTFMKNVTHIERAGYVLARIDDFDPGTMWELGYAYAHKIPLYAYTVVPDRGLNLMLAESGMKLIQGWDDIGAFVAGDRDVAKLWTKEII